MTAITPLPSLPERLAARSADYRDPLARVAWETLDRALPWMPDELVSLYGLPEWEALDLGQRQRLSHYELVVFLELGLWLEGLLMQRLATRISRGAGEGCGDLAYQLHELREEAGHSLMFVEMIRRSGLPGLGDRIPRPRAATAFARLAPFDSAGFWITILIGEAVPDQISRALYRDERLPAAVRQVADIHRREEARHIAYARKQAGERLDGLSGPRRRALEVLVAQVFRQFVVQCFYPPPVVYAAAGLPEPRALARAVRRSLQRARLAERCVSPTREFLGSHGLHLRSGLRGALSRERA